MNDVAIITADALDGLRAMPAASVQTVVTSPPYWGLRDYGEAGQIGLEATPGEYVARLVAVFGELWRVLRDDGTLWLNLGDTYGTGAGPTSPASTLRGNGHLGGGPKAKAITSTRRPASKSLVGIPWRVAFALQEAGWILRAEVIWAKPAPMPESVTDRPTRSHESLFLLAKSEHYFYDLDAIREPFADAREGRDGSRLESERDRGGRTDGFTKPNGIDPSANGGRNRRDVWTVAASPYPAAHFAVMPPKLAEPCVLAGSRPGDLVADPFAGAGTTGLVAQRLGRRFVGVEISAEYAALARDRLERDRLNPSGYLDGDPEPLPGQLGLGI